MKLKFDYYEATFRLLRKFLVENRDSFHSENDIQGLSKQYFDKADQEWKTIYKALDYNFSEENLLFVRETIDQKLRKNEAFDARVNCEINNANN